MGNMYRQETSQLCIDQSDCSRQSKHLAYTTVLLFTNISLGDTHAAFYGTYAATLDHRERQLS